jgi:hypothetical protein
MIFFISSFEQVVAVASDYSSAHASKPFPEWPPSADSTCFAVELYRRIPPLSGPRIFGFELPNTVLNRKCGSRDLDCPSQLTHQDWPIACQQMRKVSRPSWQFWESPSLKSARIGPILDVTSTGPRRAICRRWDGGPAIGWVIALRRRAKLRKHVSKLIPE